MSLTQLQSEIEDQFRSRRFAPALALAILDLLRAVSAIGRFGSLDQLLLHFPRQSKTKGGRIANTLILRVGRSTLSLRKFYEKHQDFFRVEKKRFDFPNMAPHATQAWGDYKHWFDLILNLSLEECDSLAIWAKDFVLQRLPSHDVDPSSIAPLSRPFSRLLRHFSTRAHKGEKAGASFQGLVFAYIRADAPHLFLEVAKVGAGSKRLQRVGDIDGWLGERLVLTIECKSFDVDIETALQVTTFTGEARKRRALAMIAALAFDEEAKSHLTRDDIRVVDLTMIQTLADLWDPLKQQIACDAFSYYVHHVEKNAAMMERLREFKRAEPSQP